METLGSKEIMIRKVNKFKPSETDVMNDKGASKNTKNRKNTDLDVRVSKKKGSRERKQDEGQRLKRNKRSIDSQESR